MLGEECLGGEEGAGGEGDDVNNVSNITVEGGGILEIDIAWIGKGILKYVRRQTWANYCVPRL